jgi:two-component system, sensor histidine kinase LadS
MLYWWGATFAVLKPFAGRAMSQTIAPGLPRRRASHPTFRGRFFRFVPIAVALWLLILTLPALLMSAARDDAAIVAREVIPDADGSLRFEDAAIAIGQTYREPFTRPQGGGAHWLRLTLAPSASEQVLAIRPALLDTVDVVLLDRSRREELRTSMGDSVARPAGSLPVIGLNHPLPPLPEGGILLMRIVTTGPVVALVEVTSRARFERGAHAALRQTLVFLTLKVVLLTLAIVEFVGGREAVWIWFMAQQLASGVFGLAGSGALGALLPPMATALSGQLGDVGLMAYLTTSILFHAALFKTFGAPDRALSWVRRMALLPVAAVAAYLAGAAGHALQATFWLTVAFGLAAVAAAPAIMRSEGVPVWFLQLVYVTFGSTVVMSGLLLLGRLPASLLALSGGTALSFLAGPLTLWVLLRRSALRNAMIADSLRATALAAQRAELERTARLASEQFLGVLAHTIRTPLSVIRLALEQGDDHERARRLASRAIGDVDLVLERSLTLARLESGELRLRCASVDVGRCVADAVRWSRLGDRVEVVAVPRGPVKVDAQVLAHVLFELLDNASRYADAASPVAVDCATVDEGGQLHVRVSSNTGRLGILRPERAFERYARGDRATAVTGAGLGLHLVRALARLHGGEARYEADDRTVVVEVTLPCSGSS